MNAGEGQTDGPVEAATSHCVAHCSCSGTRARGSPCERGCRRLHGGVGGCTDATCGARAATSTMGTGGWPLSGTSPHQRVRSRPGAPVSAAAGTPRRRAYWRARRPDGLRTRRGARVRGGPGTTLASPGTSMPGCTSEATARKASRGSTGPRVRRPWGMSRHQRIEVHLPRGRHRRSRVRHEIRRRDGLRGGDRSLVNGSLAEETDQRVEIIEDNVTDETRRGAWVRCTYRLGPIPSEELLERILDGRGFGRIDRGMVLVDARARHG